MACGPKTADRLSESANVGAGVGKQIRRQINLKAADSEYERKWPRIIRSISPVEEYKCAGSSLAIECKGWLPWARVPSAIFRRHYLNRCAPVRELSRVGRKGLRHAKGQIVAIPVASADGEGPFTPLRKIGLIDPDVIVLQRPLACFQKV